MQCWRCFCNSTFRNWKVGQDEKPVWIKAITEENLCFSEAELTFLLVIVGALVCVSFISIRVNRLKDWQKLNDKIVTWCTVRRQRFG